MFNLLVHHLTNQWALKVHVKHRAIARLLGHALNAIHVCFYTKHLYVCRRNFVNNTGIGGE
jgi:hypothetical protein